MMNYKMHIVKSSVVQPGTLKAAMNIYAKFKCSKTYDNCFY
jgi:hypothetical protein